MIRSKLRHLLGCAILSCATAGLAVDPYYNVTVVNSAAVVKTASGTQKYSSTDHQAAIQWAIDNLPAGRTTKYKVKLTGTFTVDDTLKLKSYLIFELAGKIKLANGVNKNLMGTATVDVPVMYVEMVGGTYDANRDNQSTKDKGYYCIELKNAQKSIFKNFIVEESGKDGFILDTKCKDNVCSDLLARNIGITGMSGNGLGDRGDNNQWTDCVTDNTYSDGWVIKCRGSTFTRCVAKNGQTGAGFGLFCDDLIANNKFYDCEVYKCYGHAFSLRKPTDPAKGDDPIRDNYFEVYLHDNCIENSDVDQMGFDLWSSRNAVNGQELIRNNKVHLLIRNTRAVGFYIKDSHVSGTTGTIVCYSNSPDARIEGHDNTLTFLVPDMNKDSITKAGNNNTVNIRTISRSDTNTSWAARKYYQLKDGTVTPPPQPSLPAVGSIITLKAVNGKYVSATYSTNNTLIANKATISNYERFKVVNATNSIALQCIGNNKFVSNNAADGSKPLVANRPSIGSFEKFKLVQSDSQIAIQSVRNTNYVSAISNGTAPLQAIQTRIGSYEKFTWKVE